MLNTIFEKIYCLSLDKRPDRWQHVQHLANRFGFDVTRVVSESFDPIVDDPKQIKQLTTPFCRNFGLRSLISCGVGHRKIWEDIARNGYQSAIVFEDDIDFIESFSNDTFASFWNEVPSDWDRVYFGHCEFPPMAQMLGRKREQISGNVHKPRFPVLAHAYALHSRSAERMLEDMKRISWYVDFQMSTDAHDGYNIYAFSRDLIQQRDHGDSEQSVAPRNFILRQIVKTKDIDHFYSLNLFRIGPYVNTLGGIAWTLIGFVCGSFFGEYLVYYGLLSVGVYSVDFKRTYPKIANTIFDIFAAISSFALGSFIAGSL